MTKLIPLTQGKFSIVDDKDYDFLMQWKWYFNKNGNYAERTTSEKKNGRKTSIKMHINIMGGSAFLIDHIDGNTLNNQKSNLRYCSYAENARNQRKRLGTSSRYKGIYWVTKRSKWHCRIMINYKYICIGYFDCEKEAAQAYNKAAIIYHGDFAKLNIIT